MPVNYYDRMDSRDRMLLGIDRAFEPMNKLVEGRTQLALADLAERRKAEDDARRLAAEMAMQTVRSKQQQEEFDRQMEKQEKFEKRRLKEARKVKEEEDLKIAKLKAIEQRIKVPAGATAEDVYALIAQRKQETTDEGLDVLMSSLNVNEAQKQEKWTELQSMMQQQSTPELRRQAVREVLADPVAEVLTDEHKKALRDALDSGKDPEKVVDKVFEDLGKGFWSGKAAKNSQAFMQRYLGSINEKLPEQKKVLAQNIMQRMRELDSEGMVYHKEVADYVVQNRDHVSKEKHQKLVERGLFYANPNAALTSVSKPKSTAPAEAPTPQAVTQPPPAPADPVMSAAPPVTQPSRTDSVMQTIGEALIAPKQPGMPPFDTAPPNMAQDYRDIGTVFADWNKRGEQARTAPIMQQDAAQKRLLVDKQIVSQMAQNPNLQAENADPNEVEQVRAVAQARFQGTPESWAKTLQAVRLGKPVDDDTRQRIAAFNYVLGLVRKTRGGAPVFNRVPF